MRLTNFEDEIDPTILKRGLDYHQREKIATVDKRSENDFVFKIAGTKRYIVTVLLEEDSDTIESTNCTCPYDWGPYCKHQVAVFYYLLEHKSERSGMINYEDLCLRLSRFYKNELIGLLIAQIKKYPAEKEYLLNKYYDQRNYPDTTYIKREIREVIAYYFDTHPDGINAFQLMDLTDDLGELIDTTFRIKGLVFYFDVALYLYTEILILKTFTTDSMGSIDALLIYLLRDVKKQFTSIQGDTDKSKHIVMMITEQAMEAPVYIKQMTHTVILLNIFKDHLVEQKPRIKYLELIDQTMEQCLTENDKVNYERLNELKRYVMKWYDNQSME
ncbi:MAG: SWIM zinc finger family protein [Alkalibacterium gilvum]